MVRLASTFLQLAVFVSCAVATQVDPQVLDACPGYSAQNVKVQGGSLSADLVLAKAGCNVFGTDVSKLKLSVIYETEERIHVKITDPAKKRYEVPEQVFPRPKVSPLPSSRSANIQFNYTTSPFSFQIYRRSTKEVLFDTASHPLIFEPQYLRVKTKLPKNANIYGFGEHTNPFHLPTNNFTLTLWSRDAYGIPTGTNLYGNHPVYFEHRTTGTHGVLLLNSNGMDIKLTDEASGGPGLEYNVIGGILDFYFFAGSETDPTRLAKQYAEVVGLPAEVPYWSLGFHQCRFGYKDFVDVARVISSYAEASIPLETMWTDIDYMDRRRIFTVDPDYFPLSRVREIVKYLHDHDQRYILMTDPAVALVDDGSYAPYDRGKKLDVWLKDANGSDAVGVVWPGVTVYPDWFHPKIQEYWNKEFQLFYNPTNGIDIDGAWIDMNEPANFCNLPCTNPAQQAIEQQMPPPRTNSPPNPNTPIFTKNAVLKKREDFLNPPYAINNAAGALSSKTAATDSVHANGLSEYDTHNLYGSMMSTATYDALLARRPGKRPFIITRSTFVGAGHHVGKWLGDNWSSWEQYRFSIAGLLGFASVFQIPVVGHDICGFGGNTTESLCARWATLGAFYPFMRNHNGDTSISQEFFVWPTTAAAARHSLDVRYRLLDYLYTALHQAHVDGTPVLHPLWFKYPKDSNTFPIDHQFFFGDSILVSPVTEDDSTTVSIYLPKDIFYDFFSLAPVQGAGSFVTLNNVDFTQIPVHIKGGAVLPLRVKGTMTTTELRKQSFELVVAPNANGQATGQLYVDDGESIKQGRQTNLKFKFAFGSLSITGSAAYEPGTLDRVRFLGVSKAPKLVTVSGKPVGRSSWSYNSTSKVLDVTVKAKLAQVSSVAFV